MIAAALECYHARTDPSREMTTDPKAAVEEMSKEAFEFYRCHIAENLDLLEYFEQATPANLSEHARIG